jgi:hypothetical protein
MSPALGNPSFQGPQEQPQDRAGRDPGGGFASPAPGRQNPEAMANLDLVQKIVSSSRMLGQKIPGAVDIVRQINELAEKLQTKIIQSGQSPETQAPPVG